MYRTGDDVDDLDKAAGRDAGLLVLRQDGAEVSVWAPDAAADSVNRKESQVKKLFVLLVAALVATGTVGVFMPQPAPHGVICMMGHYGQPGGCIARVWNI